MDGKFKVMAERCDQCLFSPERIVSGKRYKQIVQDCQQKDTFFVCHKATLAGGQEVCCRAFFDTFGNDVLITRAAKMFHAVEYVSEEQLHANEQEGAGDEKNSSR